jgi:hypothetical protein
MLSTTDSTSIKRLALTSTVLLFPILYLVIFIVDPTDPKLSMNLSAFFQHPPGPVIAASMLAFIGILMQIVEYRNHTNHFRSLRLLLSTCYTISAIFAAGIFPTNASPGHIASTAFLYTCLVFLGLLWSTSLAPSTASTLRNCLIIACVFLALYYATGIKIPGAFIIFEIIPLVLVMIIWSARPENMEYHLLFNQKRRFSAETKGSLEE